MTNTPTSYPTDALAEAKALRAENERLRAALAYIKDDKTMRQPVHFKRFAANVLKGDDQ